MCTAVGNSLLSASKEPSRLTANLWVLTVFWQAILWFVTPMLIEHWKAPGLYAEWVIACIIAFPLLLRMPDSELSVQGSAHTTRPRAPLSIVMMLSIFCCASAFWLRDS